MEPMYGELVIPFHNDNESSVQEEVSAMEEQTRLTHLMIQDAAYYLAEKRRFKPGDDWADWFQAEAQIKNSIP